MEANTKNFRDVETVQLSDCITCIDSCLDYIAVGCIDDFIYIWNSDLATFQKEPLYTRGGNAMGVIDLAFNSKSTMLAVSCMDSTIRNYDLNTITSSNIECQIMQNWKITFVDESIATGGDLGKVIFYDEKSKQKVKKFDTGEVFITALAKSYDSNFLATGNNSGDVHIVNLGSAKEKVASLKPHYKLVRDLTFLDDGSKLLTACDDNSIKVIDISSEKVVSTLEGHKQSVSSVSPQADGKLVFSSSFDKTIKSWDLRMKSCVGTAVTSNPLWDCKSIGKYLLTGGENGILNLYSVQ